MKKLFTFFLISLAGIAARAQCSGGCSTTVSSASSINYYIAPGQKLCIAPSGTVTGLIAIAGGTLCNQGTIQTSNVLISSGGYFDNSGYGDIDSLLISGTGSSFVNHGTLVHQRMATTDHAVSNNYGTVNVDYLGDSVGTYTNYGSLTIHQSLFNSYSSTFLNKGYMAIAADFLNSYSSIFATECMINVGHDWYNSAIINGSGTTCGGFRITNGSYNSGTVTATGGGVDLCDVGNTTHIDANTGTIASGVTYCSCINNCSTGVSGIEELSDAAAMSLYPNPSNSLVHLRYSKAPQLVEIYSATGQLLMSLKNESAQAGEMLLHTESLPRGIYLVTAKSKGVIIYSSRFVKD